MGSASISQVLTASFVPLLSRFQDDRDNFRRYVSKINRFTGFILFPVLTGAALAGTPLFHTLFGHKWDAAILLFQILCIRGIFIVLISLYTNYLLSLGHARRLIIVEIVKDGLIFAVIMMTIWFHSVPLLVWGQLGASLLTYAIVLVMASRATGVPTRRMTGDLLPYAVMTLLMAGVCRVMLTLTEIPLLQLSLTETPLLQLVLTVSAGVVTYLTLIHI